MTKNIKLYRPLRLKELEKIIDSGMKRFPPRSFWQPIFYPVLTYRYAMEIAEAWNVDDAFIVSFHVHQHILAEYPVKTIGQDYRQELWIPSYELEEFNDMIEGPIDVEKVGEPVLSE